MLHQIFTFLWRSVHGVIFGLTFSFSCAAGEEWDHAQNERPLAKGEDGFRVGAGEVSVVVADDSAKSKSEANESRISTVHPVFSEGSSAAGSQTRPPSVYDPNIQKQQMALGALVSESISSNTLSGWGAKGVASTATQSNSPPIGVNSQRGVLQLPVAKSQVNRDDPPQALEPFKTPDVSLSELEELLGERFMSRPIKISDSYDRRPGMSLNIFEGSFTLKTKLKHNATVKIVYRVPLSSKNNPGPDADNIVMVGMYHRWIQPRAQKVIDGVPIAEKSKLHGALIEFSDRLGYTSFTMELVATKEMQLDREEYYSYGGPEWVEIVYKAKAEIEKRHKLRERKLLLYGLSEGGTFVYNVAAAAPEKVAAIAIQSASDISLPKTPSKAAWFLAITRGDSMQACYQSAYNKLMEYGDNVVFNIFPPNNEGRGSVGFYHSQHPITTLASRVFLRGVVESYDSKGQADVKRWPYVRDRTRPLTIYPARSERAMEIKNDRKEYIPSKAFAQCLQAVPARMHTTSISMDNGKSVVFFVGIPPLGKPKGIIVYSQLFDIRTLTHMIDNIYYLAAEGYVVLAPQMKTNDSLSVLAAMKFAADSNLLSKFPMAVLCHGKAGNIVWDTVGNNTKIKPKAMAMMEFLPDESTFDESRHPVGFSINAPIKFIYEEQSILEQTTLDKVKNTKMAIDLVSKFIATYKSRRLRVESAVVRNDRSVKEHSVNYAKYRTSQLALEQARLFIDGALGVKRE